MIFRNSTNVYAKHFEELTSDIKRIILSSSACLLTALNVFEGSSKEDEVIFILVLPQKHGTFPSCL